MKCADNIIPPEGEAEHTIEIIQDYIALMGKIEDEELRTKVELELGGKMIQLRMFLSAENFSLSVVPIAGDRILVPRPRRKELPKKDDSDALPPKSEQ